MDRLNKEIERKILYISNIKILFHQDKAQARTFMKAMAKLNKLKYEFFHHYLYSPDLYPSDYYLFPKLKQVVSEEEICIK